MIPGVNGGAGKASIEKIAPDDILPKQNTKLAGVRYVIDCTAGTNDLSKVTAVGGGTDYAYGKTISSASDPQGKGGTCKQVDLGADRNLDEVATFHGVGVDTPGHRIILKTSGGTTRVIKDTTTGTNKSETSTPTGYRVSAYQYDGTTDLPSSGTYYIRPVLSEGRVLTAASTATGSYLVGNTNQKWTVEKNDNGTYKIIEQSKNFALRDSGSTAAVTAAYQNNNQYNWTLVPMGNKTYMLRSGSGNYLRFNSSNNTFVTVSSGNQNIDRFVFQQLDFSKN